MGVFDGLKRKLKEKPSVDIQQHVIRGLVTSKLYDLLKDAGLSKADLANKLNVSKAAVTGWLSGHRNFTIDTLTQIAYVMDKTPKIDFIPLNSQHEAFIRCLPTAATSIQVKSTDAKTENVVQTSFCTIKIASNDE